MTADPETFASEVQTSSSGSTWMTSGPVDWLDLINGQPDRGEHAGSLPVESAKMT